MRPTPFWSIKRLSEDLRDQGLVGEPPVYYRTLARMLEDHGWLAAKARSNERKAYEVANINDLWASNFMHGPKVLTAKGPAKAILCAILDERSRMVVGHAFSASETISSLTLVLGVLPWLRDSHKSSRGQWIQLLLGSFGLKLRPSLHLPYLLQTL